MGKVRVYELAKDLGKESKELIEILAGLGINVKNHMSALEDEEVVSVKRTIKKPQDKTIQGEAEPEAEAKTVIRKAKKKPAPKPDGDPERAEKEGKPPEPTVEGRPAADRSGDRAEGQRTEGRPAGAKPDGRPVGPRPEGKPAGPRPDGRPVGPRPEGRPAGPRPDGRPVGPRPDGRPVGPRPDGRPAGARPDGRPAGARPDDRPAGARPDGRPAGARPDGRPAGARPDGRPVGPRPEGRPAGARPDGRPAGARPDGRPVAVRQEQPVGRPGKPGDRKTGVRKPVPRTEKRDERLEKKFLDERKQQPKKSEKRVAVLDTPDKTKPAKKQKPIVIGESISVQELAAKLAKPATELIKKLMALGVLATINQEIDTDTAAILAGEFGREVEVKIEDVEIDLLGEAEDQPESLTTRPSVVTVMGHVDHGKTSLLDAIREANVTASEAGGITQHIGAYQVVHNGKKITFLDTPGHEAFTAMRARGAQATDIAIIVVAADDGVMPQTVEAINHAKAAKVPIIIAINKMDKPGANPDKVKQELTEYGLVPEEWGGETICVPVSAKTKQGLEDLLEMILLVAEMQELKANPARLAKGIVIEAELDKGRGPVATVLVQTGTLEIGDSMVAGAAFGKVRAMIDDKGRRVKKAGPSTPVEVLGLSDVPLAGDLFHAVKDDKTAKAIATRRIIKKREEDLKATAKVSLDDLFKQIKEGQVKDLNIIIKADVQGSIEALRQSLHKLSNDEVRVNPIHGGVGAITETDVMLASASNAIIIGFNVRPDTNARKAAEREKVDLRLYRVIYNAIEDVKSAMVGMLEPEFKEVVVGRAEVRQTFKVSKLGTIAGCYVTEGKITKNAEVRVIRDGIVIYEGKLESLKRFKDDVKEVLEGFECGIMVSKFNDLIEGDIIEAFVMEEVQREL